MKYRNAIERFEEKYTKSDGCWIWNAAIGSHGYGHFWFIGKPKPSHQVSHILYVGKIPDGLCVLHKCDNRKCVNPEHLFLGTNKENVSDMVAKQRQAKGEKIAASKITQEQVLEIRKDKRPQRSIGLTYGISHTLVGDIKSKKLWKHIA